MYNILTNKLRAFGIDNQNMIIPKPHSFCDQVLKSSLEQDLANILTEINKILPQFDHFIGLFYTTVSHTDVSIIVDTNGNMSMDVPANMSDADAQQLSKRLNIIDTIINSRGTELENLFKQGNVIEKGLVEQNPNFKSEILEKANEFTRLKASYKNHVID